MSLTTLLRLNALSCLGFGALFVLAPVMVADFLGSVPVWLLTLLGAGLILNGLHLAWAARGAAPATLVRYFSLGDGLWVLGSLALVVAGLWVTTLWGIVATLAVAALVGALGLGQWRHTLT